jgi:hypothetical protein
MSTMAFDKEELRRAAVAHMTARREGGEEARRLAVAAAAAAAAGMSMREIAEIIDSSSREELDEPRIAA